MQKQLFEHPTQQSKDTLTNKSQNVHTNVDGKVNVNRVSQSLSSSSSLKSLIGANLFLLRPPSLLEALWVADELAASGMVSPNASSSSWIDIMFSARLLDHWEISTRSTPSSSSSAY